MVVMDFSVQATGKQNFEISLNMSQDNDEFEK